jgi:hypothetical protein
MTVVVQSQGYYAFPFAAAHRAFASMQATVSAGMVFGFVINALPRGPSLSTWAFSAAWALCSPWAERPPRPSAEGQPGLGRGAAFVLRASACYAVCADRGPFASHQVASPAKNPSSARGRSRGKKLPRTASKVNSPRRGSSSSRYVNKVSIAPEGTRSRGRTQQEGRTC